MPMGQVLRAIELFGTSGLKNTMLTFYLLRKRVIKNSVVETIGEEPHGFSNRWKWYKEIEHTI